MQWMRTPPAIAAKIAHLYTELPRVMRVGLSLAGLGAGIDIAYHLGSSAPAPGHSSIAFFGHLITLVGMVVTLVGLFLTARRHRPSSERQKRRRRFQ